MKSPLPLILASTSIYRRALLARLQIPFECQAPGTDETPRHGEAPLAFVVRLALAKARSVAARCPDAWVIGSDQVAVRGEEVLGKPGTAERCIEQLLTSSGETVSFVTAVAVLRGALPAIEFVDTTRVVFHRLDRTIVERYVTKEAPVDCAGGFKSEGLGIALCRSIDCSDPTALIGLPLIRLAEVLRGVGFDAP